MSNDPLVVPSRRNNLDLRFATALTGSTVVLAVATVIVMPMLTGRWSAVAGGGFPVPTLPFWTAISLLVHVAAAGAGLLIGRQRERDGAARAALVLYWAGILVQATWLASGLFAASGSQMALVLCLGVLAVLDAVTVATVLAAWSLDWLAAGFMVLVLSFFMMATWHIALGTLPAFAMG